MAGDSFPSTAGRLSLERAAALVAVGAVLLPLTGAVARWALFGSSRLDIPNAQQIAFAEPAPQLGVEGLLALLPALVYVVLFWVLLNMAVIEGALSRLAPRILPMLDPPDFGVELSEIRNAVASMESSGNFEGLAEVRERTHRLGRAVDTYLKEANELGEIPEFRQLLTRSPGPYGIMYRFIQRIETSIGRSRFGWLIALVATTTFVVFAVQFLFLTDWPVLVLSIGVAIVFNVGRLWAVRPHVGLVLSRAVATMFVGSMLAAIGSGLADSDVSIQTADFVFDPSVSGVVAAGRYDQLGDDGTLLYLHKCGSSVPLYAVPKSDIRAVVVPRADAIAYRPEASPSGFVEMLRGATPLGYRGRCQPVPANREPLAPSTPAGTPISSPTAPLNPP